jgi:hypothetical protein
MPVKVPQVVNLDRITLRISKASFVMASWGFLILSASLVNQYFIPVSYDTLIAMWSVATVLGIIVQVFCLARKLGPNFAVWMVVIVAGWLFTHTQYYADFAGVWLLLLGIGYVATAVQVNRRFTALAVLHLAAGVVFELSARKIVPMPWLDSHTPLAFGLVAGLSMIVGALPIWYRPKEPQATQAHEVSANGREQPAQQPGEKAGVH